VYEFVNSVTLWGDHVVPITPQNIENKAIILVDQYKKKAALFKTGDNVLVPLGKSAHTHTHAHDLLFKGKQESISKNEQQNSP
jgi:hypothetical protein